MRIRILFLAAMMTAAPARAVCAGTAMVRDWGLHRQWAVESDPEHPERPPRLVQVAWSETARKAVRGAPQAGDAGQMECSHPVVAGMRVRLASTDDGGTTELIGTALEAGCTGRTIRVRAGLHGAVLRGVVQGPGRVQLEPGKRR